MAKVTQSTLPDGAFLLRYNSQVGAYTDCFVAHVSKPVALEAFISTFFDTWVFRLERKILSAFMGTASSAADVQAIASGASTQFASWQVEQRGIEQILLKVGDGPIRTWLMRRNDGQGTQLFFGSAVLPMSRAKDGTPKMGFAFRALLGFHTLYSKVLLGAALRKLR